MGASEKHAGRADQDGVQGLRLPRCDSARHWVESSAAEAPGSLATVLRTQRSDGSWGGADDLRRRVLPTLWTASVLGDLGHAGTPAWSAAADFLSRNAATADGVFSRDGTRTGVLACYVGIAAGMYLHGGRNDLAAPQVDWILRYQDVRTGGCSRRGGVPVYETGLATRYGGCLAATSCLIGVVKSARALELWRRDLDASRPAPHDGVDEMLGVVREALLERHLLFRRDGAVLPLGTPASRAHEWLSPTFPLDWRTDLVEVIELVARTGPPDERMQPALDHLAAQQLPGGSWPLRRSFWPPGFPALEPRSARRPSRLATRRVLQALSALRPATSPGPDGAPCPNAEVSHPGG